MSTNEAWKRALLLSMAIAACGAPGEMGEGDESGDDKTLNKFKPTVGYYTVARAVQKCKTGTCDGYIITPVNFTGSSTVKVTDCSPKSVGPCFVSVLRPVSRLKGLPPLEDGTLVHGKLVPQPAESTKTPPTPPATSTTTTPPAASTTTTPPAASTTKEAASKLFDLVFDLAAKPAQKQRTATKAGQHLLVEKHHRSMEVRVLNHKAEEPAFAKKVAFVPSTLEGFFEKQLEAGALVFGSLSTKNKTLNLTNVYRVMQPQPPQCVVYWTAPTATAAGMATATNATRAEAQELLKAHPEAKLFDKDCSKVNLPVTKNTWPVYGTIDGKCVNAANTSLFVQQIVDAADSDGKASSEFKPGKCPVTAKPSAEPAATK